MATKKDLVEAHSFSRRRLVTAFLSGAPGGREVEPSRPGRTIVGGVALSILLVAGAAIASVLAARTPEDWNKAGLILSRENAALYVILEKSDPPVLHPVINATSAQLIFGADAPPTIVARDTVDQQTPGDTIGIFGAPNALPTVDDLVQTGWTACTGDGLGIKVDIDTDQLVTPAVRADPASAQPDAGYVVRTDDGKAYLVATGPVREDGQRARYFAIPNAGLDGALSDLGLPPTDEAIKVPGDWLRLFEPGGRLDWKSFGIAQPGAALPQALAASPDLAAQGARVGDYVPPAADSGNTTTVLTLDGPLELDPFAAAIYAATTVPGTSAPPRPLDPGTQIPRVGFAARAYQDNGWPDGLLTQPPTQPCAVLTPTPGDTPSVQLATDPQGEASAADVTDPEVRDVRVEPGKGAFVYDGAFDESTSDAPVVIDAKGDVYPLVGDDTIDSLGYGKVDVTVVPDPWIELFDQGVALSTSAALCPPDPAGAAPDQDCTDTDTGTGEETGEAGDTGVTP